MNEVLFLVKQAPEGGYTARALGLRLYRLTEPVELHIKEYGNFRAVDFDGPLVI